jgi:glutaminyl-tRNA synthetase
MEDAPKKYFRLAPGAEVRLRYCCYITAKEVVKDADGNIVEILAEFDPESRGANTPDGRRVKGTIHFVSATENVPLAVRLYDHLFLKEDPEEGGDFIQNLNPDSLQVITAYGEPELANSKLGEPIQFERKGYFSIDPDSAPGKIVFNRTVVLRDSWGKQQGK